MALMEEADAVEVWREWMTKNTDPIGADKHAIRAAVDAADQWVQDNKASFNSALPTGAGSFRAEASARQKAALLMYVIFRRFLKGVD